MSFFGCESWPDFLAKLDAGLDLAEPGGLIFAEFSSDGGRHEATAAWREGEGFRLLRFHHAPNLGARPRADFVHLSELDAEEGLWRLVSTCSHDLLLEAGLEDIHGRPEPHHAELSRHVFGRVRSILAEVGARVAWQVTRRTGQWEDRHTQVVAVYDDPRLAAAHARAARLAEEAEEDPEGEFEGPSGWGVGHVIARTELPPGLRGFASGERVPPERPSRFRTETYGYLVRVPGRGEVEIDDFGCERVSAALLCSLPLAKPTMQQRWDARGGSALADVRPEGEGAVTYAFGDAGSDGPRGVARATGPDAAALLAAIPGAVAAQVEATRREEDAMGLDGEGEG